MVTIFCNLYFERFALCLTLELTRNYCNLWVLIINSLVFVYVKLIIYGYYFL